MTSLIVNRMGYMKYDSIIKLDHFSIYETTKKTQILVINTSEDQIYLWYPKMDRLPYKTVEGKKICGGKKIFDSKINYLSELNTTKWNNGNQIMCYEPIG